MSKTVDNNLKVIASAFKGFFKDLETIAVNIAALKKTRADMEAAGSYTKSYIDDVMEKEIEKKAVIVSGAADTISAGVEDLKEAALNILNASDVLEDARITPALSSVGSLTGREGVAASEIIARQFAGNFPVLNLLAASASDASVKAAFIKHSIDAEGVETMADNIGGAAVTIKSSRADITDLATRIYTFEKELKADAALFGISINTEEYKALAALMEAKEVDDVRKAMGL